jgi:hypothetical protein
MGKGGKQRVLGSCFNGGRAMNGKPIKVMLRVCNHEQTLEREFSNFYEAQGAIELMHKNDPDLIIEPHVRLSDSCEIEISSIATDTFAACPESRDSDSLRPAKP